jgi:hypothetical protein
MALVFTYPEECVIDNPVPLEIDLKRFLAVNRRSGYFVSPHSPEPYFMEAFRHYDQRYRQGVALPLAELDIDKGALRGDPEYLGVVDGRKRLAWLARQGEETAPVLVPRHNLAAIKKLIGARHERYNLGQPPTGLIGPAAHAGQTQRLAR